MTEYPQRVSTSPDTEDEFNPFAALKTRSNGAPTIEQPKGAEPVYNQWRKTKAPQDLRAVVNQYDKTISSAMREFAGTVDSPIIRKRAEIMAAKAIQTFDPNRGASLATHIWNQLQPLRRIAPNINDPLPKPERLRREAAVLNSARVQLMDKLGREPTIDELADQTNYDSRKISRLMRREKAIIAESSLMPPGEGDEEDEDFLPGTQREDPINIYAQFVYHDLPPRDKLIFQYRTGWGGSPVLSNREIARRLNVSEATVSKRAAALENKLNEFVADMQSGGGLF